MKIAGLHFDDECPRECPGFKENVGQGGVCHRCPVFNCSWNSEMEFRLVEPDDFLLSQAQAYRAWFDTGMEGIPCLAAPPTSNEDEPWKNPLIYSKKFEGTCFGDAGGLTEKDPSVANWVSHCDALIQAELDSGFSVWLKNNPMPDSPNYEGPNSELESIDWQGWTEASQYEKELLWERFNWCLVPSFKEYQELGVLEF